MGIVDEDVARVRSESDIVAVVTQYTQLRRVGRRFTGLCPFHSEKTPSFSVNFEEGLYHCFGCGVGGDVIKFAMEKEQLDFVGAVESLAHRANITLRYTTADEGSSRRRRSQLQEVVAKAAGWYHHRLLTAEDAGAARSYLRSRGYDGEIVRRYQIGWAPDGWDTLARSLKIPDDDLVDSGLGFINRRSRQQDAFRARVLFPIFDAQGAAVGFGGRIMPGHDGPKYKNSSESTVYAKSRLLYGLNWAKTAIVEADEVIVCEGYTDVIGFAVAGLDRAVATCGTALTDEHVKMLRRFAQKVVLAFDADSAGQDAAARFYAWEKEHDIDVAVADLPAGQDPGDLARSDPDRLVAAIEGAKPFLEFRINRVLDDADMSSAEGRAKGAERALSMIREHPDALVRDQYVVSVASRCRLDLNLLRAQLSAGERSQTRARPRSQAVGRAGPHQSPELEALKLLVHRRDEMADLLCGDLFVDPLCAAVYELLLANDGLHDVMVTGGPEVAELVQRLSVDESEAEPMDVAARLWENLVEMEMASSKEMLGHADAATRPHIFRHHTWLRLQLEDIRNPGRQAEVIAELLAWLREGEDEEPSSTTEEGGS